MLPRRRVSAPESRVYESGSTLHQVKFTSPPKIKKKRVKSYGKKTTVRIPKPKDNTLTQMGFVTNNSPPDPESDEGDEGYEELAEKRRTKRRKTTGDQSSTGAEFHTQTISQLVRSFSSAHDLEEEQEHVQEHDIFDVPSSSPGRHQRKPPRRGRSLALGKENQAPTVSTQGSKQSEKSILSEKSQDRAMMPPPQTPRRTRALEIPSSESPATPLSLPSHGSLRAFPLQEQATNIPINFGSRRTPEGSADLARQDEPASAKSLKPVQFPLFFNDGRTSRASPGLDSGSVPELPRDRKPVGYPLFWNPNPRRGAETSSDRVPKLEIKDTYDTAADTSQITRLPSSPTLTRSSPPKSVRFAVSNESMDVGTPRVSLSRQPSLTTSQPPSTRPIKTEILDSDAESEDEYYANDEEKPEVTEATNIQENDHEVKHEDPSSPVRDNIIEDGGYNSNYGDGEADADEPTIQPEHMDEVNEEVVEVLGEEDSTGLDHESDYGVIGAETQFQVDKIISSSHLDDLQEKAHSEDTAHETVIEKTQYMATQRIDTQYMNTMPARTAESDVFVSMSSAELTTMLDRTRNHLIRNWKLPPKVCRVWIYETQPVSTVQYMAEISYAKRPGQLPQHGVNNGAFNARPANTTYNAYEILQLYELIDPVQLNILLERGWFDEPPRRWQKVAPAVIDELVCNLKPPLFHVGGNVQSPPSSVTDTQEVDGQLLSNMQQFTQRARGDEERIPSSPFRLPALKDRSSIKGKGCEVQHDLPPSQATTVDLSQTQTPRKRHSSIEIIMESPTRPTRVEIPSSTPPQLPKLRTPLASAWTKEFAMDDIEEDPEPESLVPYSMASSQLKLLTKSQLLSDTLLQDSIPGPPEWVADSEEDDDYDDL